MEQAALNRMAKSIAQLTLCQVTGEEIATATKLLEKACQKLRGIPQRGNYINLVAFWIVARSQQAMKSVKHRKLSCYCPFSVFVFAVFLPDGETQIWPGDLRVVAVLSGFG